MVQATMMCSWLMSDGWLPQGEVTMQEVDPAFNEMRMALDLKDNQSCTPLHLALMHGVQRFFQHLQSLNRRGLLTSCKPK